MLIIEQKSKLLIDEGTETENGPVITEVKCIATLEFKDDYSAYRFLAVRFEAGTPIHLIFKAIHILSDPSNGLKLLGLQDTENGETEFFDGEN